MIKFCLMISLLIFSTTTSFAQLVTGTPEQKLQALLRPHVYMGGIITPDIKAATGDPNIPVIDRRYEFGAVYTCNYQYLRGRFQGRTLVCD